MRNYQDLLSCQTFMLDLELVVGKGFFCCYFKAPAIGGRNIVAMLPDVDLLLTLLLARIIHFQTTQVAIVPFIWCLVLLDWNVLLAKRLENNSQIQLHPENSEVYQS